MYSEENIKNNLADQTYWDSSYATYELSEGDDNDTIKHWLRAYVPATNLGTCLEIGCFPGRYLAFMGKLGYTLHGIDLTPRVLEEFPAWLKKLGYKTGTFKQEDFFKFQPAEKFDVVCSFGFIEHFTNWQEVFLKHLSMVKPGGYVVIETPNFRGTVQRLIHYYLDRENYERHYIPAMNPDKWEKLCLEKGFEVKFKGYLGDFQFWVDQPPVSSFKKKVFGKLIDWTPRLKKLPVGKKMYSPYCGIIAQLKK